MASITCEAKVVSNADMIHQVLKRFDAHVDGSFAIVVLCGLGRGGNSKRWRFSRCFDLVNEIPFGLEGGDCCRRCHDDGIEVLLRVYVDLLWHLGIVTFRLILVWSLAKVVSRLAITSFLNVEGISVLTFAELSFSIPRPSLPVLCTAVLPNGVPP